MVTGLDREIEENRRKCCSILILKLHGKRSRVYEDNFEMGIKKTH
jgi:hypothetical protein